LLPDEGKDLKQFLDNHAKQLTQLSTVYEYKAWARVKLRALHQKIGRIADDIDHIVISELLERTNNSYFWLSNAYSGYTIVNKTQTTCTICCEPAALEQLSHPWKAISHRSRTICERCGITSDVPSMAVQIRLQLKSLGQDKSYISLAAEGPPELCSGVLGVSFNKGQSIAMGSLAMDAVRLPTKLDISGESVVSVCHKELKRGVYFIKAFFISNLQLAEASLPLQRF
jgi:hypothetical protein